MPTSNADMYEMQKPIFMVIALCTNTFPVNIYVLSTLFNFSLKYYNTKLITNKLGHTNNRHAPGIGQTKKTSSLNQQL